MDSQALRVAYEENFQARTYLEMYGRLDEDVETFQVDQLHRIFQSGKVCSSFVMLNHLCCGVARTEIDNRRTSTLAGFIFVLKWESLMSEWPQNF